MTVIINVRDTYGKLVRSGNHDCSVGISTLNIVSPETPGFYVVEVAEGDKILSQQKLVITR
jgi:hypothetical protein